MDTHLGRRDECLHACDLHNAHAHTDKHRTPRHNWAAGGDTRDHTYGRAHAQNPGVDGHEAKPEFTLKYFTSLHDTYLSTHFFSYRLHLTPPPPHPHPSLSLSPVSWPAAIAASRRALLMMVLKEPGKRQGKREKKNEADSFFFFFAPQHPQIQSSRKEKKERQCSFSEQSLSVFSSSSAPKC